ncbi:PD-(D/E)XK nuclease domain-containing protein [Candidatus Entotheonella palauensis]|uniref:PD-(D/E)XK nuclease domain-containing protein n=1 Tax=Candidatus Entotheonella palauensis TaxID=93172 RepID=UPI0015C49C81|nr:PD-(D/E)XK nuclease domain-containing protein [Candidatus Entotheonella palauensis]
MLEALIRGDALEVEQLLTTLIQSASIHDVARQPENFYHGIIFGILRAFATSYEVLSNREPGFGRPDVLIRPPQAGSPGVVLEFKAVNNNRHDDFEQALQSALQQIQDQDYATELRAFGAQPIHEFAVVFAGKRVRVRKQEISPDEESYL